MQAQLALPRKISIKEWVIAFVAIVVFALAYTQVLNIYRAEDLASKVEFSAGDASNPDHLQVDSKVMSIDPIKGDMVVRLQFVPNGALLAQDNVSLAQNLVLDMNAASGKAQYVFKKGERMGPIDLTVSLFNGSSSDYPFDTHEAQLVMDLGAPLPPAEGAAKDAPVEYEQVPMVLNYSGALTGFKIQAAESADNEPGYTQVDMQIARSLTVISFACFVMFLKWLLAAGALFVMLAVVVRKRKIELGMLSWLAALLFALPPLRNAMPGVPPIGTLSDFLSFFWAEGIVALCLGIIVFNWVLRPVGK